MNCVILQPSYIPWRGVFHQIQKADVFVFYDDVQYDKHGWRNRNRVKTSSGSLWLTIPVLNKNHEDSKLLIKDVTIKLNTNWTRKHFDTLRHSYNKAPFFGYYLPLLEEFYTLSYELLADFTIETTIRLARELGLSTQFVRSSVLGAEGTKTDRLISILKKVGATNYISGPSARNYLEEEKFHQCNITLEYIRYNYPEYVQLHPPYDSQVSILDLLFMHGPDTAKYIWDVPAEGRET